MLYFMWRIGPWSRVFPYKLTVPQVAQKFPAFYGTLRFITAFTSVCHLSLSWTTSIQSMPSHPICGEKWRSAVKACVHYVWGNIRNYIQYFLPLVLFFLMCIFVNCSCLECIFVILYLLVVYVYCCFTLDAGLLARGQYQECPATGHLDTGFSWFRCVYKRMVRWFPSFQVATTCFSCSPPDLNSLAT
jgi:hypothetical protein